MQPKLEAKMLMVNTPISFWPIIMRNILIFVCTVCPELYIKTQES